MKTAVAQLQLAELIKKELPDAAPHFWRLSGDHANSLSSFLGIHWEDLKLMLRLCGVHRGETDFIKKNKLLSLFQDLCGCECTLCKHSVLKADWHVKIGVGTDVARPGEMHNNLGDLILYPVQGQHVKKKAGTRSRSGPISSLLEAARSQVVVQKETRLKESKKKSPREALIEFASEMVADAASAGKKTIDPRLMRAFRKQLTEAVELQSSQVLHEFMERLEKLADAKGEVCTPDGIASVNSVEATVVTPVDLNNELDGEEAEETDVAVEDFFLQHLREEVLLQSLLHKKMNENKDRHFEVRHKNGRKLAVVCPPDSQTAQTFEADAKRSGWVEDLLDSPPKKEGMLSHLTKAAPEKFKELAKKAYALEVSTPLTMAFARVGGLNDTRLRNVRSLLRHMCNINMKPSEKEVEEIDREVGVHRTKDATYGQCTHEWADEKGKEKKSAESIDYWNSCLMDEICCEVDIYLSQWFRENPPNEMPCIDYEAKGFDSQGATALTGGDHGDKNCPISAKINLSSPQKRKQLGPGFLNHQCPMAQFASIKCAKDTCSLLDNTVKPKVAEEITRLQSSSVVTVYDKKNITKTHCSHWVPDAAKDVAFVHNEGTNKMTCSFTRNSEDDTVRCAGSIELSKEPSEVPVADLAVKVVVSRFNDPHVGDLAFLCVLIGMNDSDGDWCPLCHLVGSQFNCTHDKQKVRSQQTLQECLEECLLLCGRAKEKNKKSLPANYKGVNNKPLVNIDPCRILVPILHCPMGLADKILETFMHLVCCEVEQLPPELESIRLEHELAKQEYDAAVGLVQDVEALMNDPTIVISSALRKQLANRKKTRAEANRIVSATKARLDDGLSRHNARSSSLEQQFEGVHRENGVTREHYHGGKFNGVNCNRITQRSKDIFIGDDNEKGGFLELCLEKKQVRMSTDTARKRVKDYEQLLGMMDATWSRVRGLECGLLPTDEDAKELNVAVNNCKEKWLAMGLTTAQPKWHLTFDKHLVDQYEKWGGLADKADDSIEAFHQTLMKLRDRFRGSRACKQREECIRRELRRKQSTKIGAHIVSYEAKLKKATPSKRSKECEEVRNEKKRIKLEKRNACVNSQCKCRRIFC